MSKLKEYLDKVYKEEEEEEEEEEVDYTKIIFPVFFDNKEIGESTYYICDNKNQFDNMMSKWRTYGPIGPETIEEFTDFVDELDLFADNTGTPADTAVFPFVSNKRNENRMKTVIKNNVGYDINNFNIYILGYAPKPGEI